MSMKRPEFTKEQEYWLCETLDWWYLDWKHKMTDKQHPHYLGIAKEQLKQKLCEGEVDRSLEILVRKDDA